MLPALRKKLKNVSSKSQSLQDILRTCRAGKEAITITAKDNGIHNTQLVVLMEDGEKRVQFYDRLPLNVIIPTSFIPSGNITTDIAALSNMGYDFTADDLEIVNGKLKAKETSLGYIGTFGAEVGGLCSIATNRVHIYPDFWFGAWTNQGYLNPVKWDIKVNGILYPFTETGVGAKGIEEEGSEFITWFKDWVIRFKGIAMFWTEVPNGTIPGKEVVGYYKYVNFSDMCYEFELIPSRNYLSEVPNADGVRELSGNPSYTTHPDGRITFALAAFQTTCTMPNAKLTSLKPINYNFVGKETAGIDYTIEDIVTGVTTQHAIVVDIKEVDGTSMSTRVSDIHGLLVINSNVAYPSHGHIFYKLYNELATGEKYLPIKFTGMDDVVQQTGPTTQVTYLGLSANVLNTPTGQFDFYLKEIEKIPTGLTRLVNDFGTIQITASDFDDLFNRVSAFYKPKLEAAGFLVEEYNVTNSPNHTFPIISNRGFKLTKTSGFDVGLDLLPRGGGTNVWSSFDGDSWRANFTKTEVSAPLVTEEMIKDEMEFIIAPIGSAEEFQGFEAGAKRITFHAKNDAGSAHYDWITENNNGQPIVFETCGMMVDLPDEE